MVFGGKVIVFGVVVYVSEAGGVGFVVYVWYLGVWFSLVIGFYFGYWRRKV